MNVLLLLALAAPPPATSESTLTIPHVSATAVAVPFAFAVSDRTGLPGPTTLAYLLHPLFALDVTSRAGLIAAGVEPDGQLYQYVAGKARVVCLQVADTKKYAAQATAALAEKGDVMPAEFGGTKFRVARAKSGQVRAAIATSGTTSCAIVGDSIVGQYALLMKALKRSPPLQPAGPGFAHVTYATGPSSGTVSISAAGLTASAVASLRDTFAVSLLGAGNTPYADLPRGKLLAASARVAPDSVRSLAEMAFGQLGVNQPAALAATVAPLLAGNLAVVATSFTLSSGLSNADGVMKAAKGAVLIEVRDVAALSSLIAERGVANIHWRDNTYSVELVGSTLVVSNDARAREAATEILASPPAPQAHGLVFTLSGPVLADVLGQLTLMDTLRKPRLAPILAFSAQFGKLMRSSRPFQGWMDGVASAQRVYAAWTLEPLPQQ